MTGAMPSSAMRANPQAERVRGNRGIKGALDQDNLALTLLRRFRNRRVLPVWQQQSLDGVKANAVDRDVALSVIERQIAGQENTPAMNRKSLAVISQGNAITLADRKPGSESSG